MAQIKQADREQARERINTLRIIGGLLVIVGLLLYFFHMAEARTDGATLGALAAALIISGAALLCTGWLKMRALR